MIAVPYHTLEGDANGYAASRCQYLRQEILSKYAHRVINGGIGAVPASGSTAEEVYQRRSLMLTSY
ncbi:hypothetical protein AB0758_48660 [Tolypothrix bouteillei VB521301_2]|uniref:hypothetical protein n=1 Tax=Tolypothrix bouteillei TaxID=1246981 RepID=UPI0038B4C5B0